MPIYDYRCAGCGHRFEVIHAVHGPGPDGCPSCGAPEIRKEIAAPAIHFKGTGWAKKERTASSPGKADSTGEAGTPGKESSSPAPAAATSSADSSAAPAPASTTATGGGD
jgi:putative FmdB family regulatory protein